MRLPSFPMPQEGEIVKSMFARFEARFGLGSAAICKIVDKPGRSAGVVFNPIFPTCLDRFSAVLPIGHPCRDIENVIRYHTGFNYYTYFDTDEFRRHVLASFVTSSNPAIRSTLGLCRYRCGGWTAPRFCRECYLADLCSLGFSYFRREHQLPGVLMCWRHGCLLATGCRKCGVYPIRGYPLCMAGTCLCDHGADPLAIVTVLPAPKDVLMWLARESAYLVQAEMKGREFVKENIHLSLLDRRELTDRGRLSREGVALALEKRYGRALLDYLRFPAFIDGRPTIFWTRAAREKIPRKPTIILLMLSGLVRESIRELDGYVRIQVCATKKAPSVKVSMPSAKDMRLALNKFTYDLHRTATHLGIPQWTLKQALIDAGIRVPLTPLIVRRIGAAKIRKIKGCLEKGMSYRQIASRFNIPLSALTRVRLDDPTVVEKGRIKARERKRDYFRRRLRQYQRQDPEFSRTKLKNCDSNAIRYFRLYDKTWFDQHLPKRESKVLNWRQNWRRELSMFDTNGSDAVSRVAHELRTRPERLTEARLLSTAGIHDRYRTNRGALPRITEALRREIETKEDHLRRKADLIISESLKDGKPVTAQLFQRRFGKLDDSKLGIIHNTLLSLAGLTNVRSPELVSARLSSLHVASQLAETIARGVPNQGFGRS